MADLALLELQSQLQADFSNILSRHRQHWQAEAQAEEVVRNLEEVAVRHRRRLFRRDDTHHEMAVQKIIQVKLRILSRIWNEE
jgi:hypothetical protein